MLRQMTHWALACLVAAGVGMMAGCGGTDTKGKTEAPKEVKKFKASKTDPAAKKKALESLQPPPLDFDPKEEEK